MCCWLFFMCFMSACCWSFPFWPVWMLLICSYVSCLPAVPCFHMSIVSFFLRNVTHVLCACCWLFIHILPGSCWCFMCCMFACCWCVHTSPVSLSLFVSCVSSMHAVAFPYVPCWPALASRFFQVHLLFGFLMCHECLLPSFCMFPILLLMIVSCLSFESAVWCG